MIQFPETAQTEWDAVAARAHRAVKLKARLSHDSNVEAHVEKLRVNHEAREAYEQELAADITPPVVIQTMEQYLLANNPVLVDLIDGVVKEDSVCLMLGPSGAGKSSLMVQMAHSLLTGTDWLGQPVQAITGSVGLLSYDQSVAIPVNWMSKMGVPFDRVFPIDLNGKGNPLKVPTERARLASAFRAAKVEVILLDSFSAAFSGDQNDAGLVMAWYADIKRFALGECGARTVIVLVHSTPANPLKPRGSTVHSDVADSVVAVVRQPTNERKVEMVKYRAGLNQTEMNPVVVTPPDDVTHLMGLDLGAMSLAGLAIPASVVGTAAFTALPEVHEQPDTESDTEDEDL